MVVKVSPANSAGGTRHWQTVGVTKVCYVLLDGTLIGPLFSDELRRC